MRFYYPESEIVSFILDGADPAERIIIAAQMNCCNETAIIELLRKNGICIVSGSRKVGRKSSLKPGQYQQMKDAIARGVRYSEIAKLLGVHKGTITYYAKKFRKEKEKL